MAKTAYIFSYVAVKNNTFSRWFKHNTDNMLSVEYMLDTQDDLF